MPTQTKKITIDTGAIFFGKFGGLLLGMIRLNYLARYLGVLKFGILNFATFFCSLFVVLYDLGISQLLTRDVAQDLSISRTYVGKVIVLKMIIVFFTSIAVGIVAIVSHFDQVTNWAILLTTVVFAINGLSAVFFSAFQAHRKMLVVSLVNMMNDLILSISIILFIAEYPYVMTVMILSVISALLSLAISIFAYVRVIGVPILKIDTAYWKSMLQEGLPFAISGIGISMYLFIGATILKYTRGDIEVGIYSTGYKLISILTLIPTAFTQVLYPIFSDFYVNAKGKLVKSLTDSLRVMSIISVPLVVGTVLLAPKIINLFFTPEFSSGTIVLQIMIVSIVLGYLNWILYSFLLATHQQKFSMIVSLAVGIIITIISAVFVPMYGYIALPFITIAAEGMLFSGQAIYLRKNGIRATYLRQLIKPGISSLIMGLILYSLSGLNLFVLVVIGGGSYIGALYLIGGYGPQEKELLQKIFSKISGDRREKNLTQ
jgi:O-antigen/teichoic acid export membrane protein